MCIPKGIWKITAYTQTHFGLIALFRKAVIYPNGSCTTLTLLRLELINYLVNLLFS